MIILYFQSIMNLINNRNWIKSGHVTPNITFKNERLSRKIFILFIGQKYLIYINTYFGTKAIFHFKTSDKKLHPNTNHNFQFSKIECNSSDDNRGWRLTQFDIGPVREPFIRTVVVNKMALAPLLCNFINNWILWSL